MGKKKVVKKTKELSVAIAESSAMSGDSQQQQQITPRKRGRPRKSWIDFFFKETYSTLNRLWNYRRRYPSDCFFHDFYLFECEP